MGRIRAGLVLVGLLAAAPAAHGLHRDTGPAARITHGAGGTIPRTRGWRTWLPFTSTDDLTGIGSSGRQAFVFDLWTYDCVMKPLGRVLAGCPPVSRPWVVQVTAGGGAPDNPTVNGRGTVVAFDADGVYAGGIGPAAPRRQVFLLHRPSGALVRVTNAADGDSVRPSLDDAGTTLVFESTAALAGGPGGVSQVFVYDVGTGVLERLTSGAGPSTAAMLDKTGSRVAFASTAALVGDGHDTGISQVFWYERNAAVLHQMTSGNASSRHPYIGVVKPASPLRRLLGLPRMVGGRAIVFESEATDLPGTRGAPGPQIYYGPITQGDVPVLYQLTPPPVPGCTPSAAAGATDPAIEPVGRRVLFTSTGDLLCNGTTGRRLFAFGMSGRPVLRQLTASGDVEQPAAALGGWFVALSSNADLSGTGTCGPQLHVLNYFEGQWRAATAPGEIPMEPSPGDPASSCGDLDACTTDRCVAGTCVHSPIAGCTGALGIRTRAEAAPAARPSPP
ncbi:MAG: hypothetical protein U0807_05385 [Candidatus Binatia bacterium]